MKHVTVNGEPARTFASEAIALVLGVPICIAILLAIEFNLWKGVTFWMGAFLFVVFSIVMTGYALSPSDLERDIEHDLARGEKGEYFIIGMPYLHFWSMVLLVRGIWNQFGPAAFPAANNPTFYDWTAFVLDRFLGVVLFDAPDTFEFHFCAIEPGPSKWLRALLFLYKFVVSIAFISILVVSYRKIFTRKGENV